jgi:hypothetical protein
MIKNIIKIVVLWAALSITESFAASATATQTVGFSVQEVALISVGNDVTISLDAITNAGDSFANKTMSNASTFAITSTVVAGNTRQVAVRMSEAISDLNLVIQMTETSLGPSPQVTLTTGDQTVLTGIGNIATNGGKITYILKPQQAVVSHRSKTITVTYTLSDDS